MGQIDGGHYDAASYTPAEILHIILASNFPERHATCCMLIQSSFENVVLHAKLTTK